MVEAIYWATNLFDQRKSNLELIENALVVDEQQLKRRRPDT